MSSRNRAGTKPKYKHGHKSMSWFKRKWNIQVLALRDWGQKWQSQLQVLARTKTTQVKSHLQQSNIVLLVQPPQCQETNRRAQCCNLTAQRPSVWFSAAAVRLDQEAQLCVCCCVCAQPGLFSFCTLRPSSQKQTGIQDTAVKTAASLHTSQNTQAQMHTQEHTHTHTRLCQAKWVEILTRALSGGPNGNKGWILHQQKKMLKILAGIRLLFLLCIFSSAFTDFLIKWIN